MIYLLLIAAVVSVAQCSPAKPVLVLHPKLVAFMTEKMEVCQIETKANPIVLKNVLPWNLKESETNGKFLYCLMREMDFQDGDDGHLNEDKFMQIFDESLKNENKNELKNLLTQCNQEVGENQYLTVFRIANCFQTSTPMIMSLK